MSLPQVVGSVVDHYLNRVDAALPGLVEGLYLVGSVALGDFRPRSSDIDFVAVTAERPGPVAVNRLRQVHDEIRARQARPYFDGSYVTWAELARAPETTVPAAGAHEGRLHVPGPDNIENPVTWHMLARSGVACRGPAPADVDVFLDGARLTAWTLRNLDQYWRDYWLCRSQHLLTPRGLFGLTPYAAVWVVTGVSRMHCTALTGEIIAKEAAAHYALATFPERWHRLIDDCLRIRRADAAGTGVTGGFAAGFTEYFGRTAGRPLYRTPAHRRRDVLAFGEMVIDDVHRRAVGRTAGR